MCTLKLFETSIICYFVQFRLQPQNMQWFSGSSTSPRTPTRTSNQQRRASQCWCVKAFWFCKSELPPDVFAVHYFRDSNLLSRPVKCAPWELARPQARLGSARPCPLPRTNTWRYTSVSSAISLQFTVWPSTARVVGFLRWVMEEISKNFLGVVMMKRSD